MRIVAGHDDQTRDVHLQQIVDLFSLLFDAAECEPNAELIARRIQSSADVIHHVQAERRRNVFEHQTDQAAPRQRFARTVRRLNFAHKRAAPLYAENQPVVLQHLQRFFYRDFAHGIAPRQFVFSRQLVLRS